MSSFKQNSHLDRYPSIIDTETNRRHTETNHPLGASKRLPEHTFSFIHPRASRINIAPTKRRIRQTSTTKLEHSAG